MTIYTESSALSQPGTTYRRTRYIGIHNNTNQTATVQLLEADAAFINGVKRNIDEGVGGIGDTIDLTDPVALSASFPLRDPSTDEVIPGATATVGQAFGILYAYARELQIKRDAAAPC